MIFDARKTSNSLNAKESELYMENKRIVGQVLASTQRQAEQLAKLKPGTTATVEKWKQYYVVTFFEES